MTEKDAEELLEQIIITLNNESKKNGIPEVVCERILMNCIELVVDEYNEKQFMFLTDKPTSVKVSNITVELKHAIIIAMELMLSLSMPDSKEKAIQIILLVVLKIYQLSEKELTSEMVLVVQALHSMNAYRIPISIENIEEYLGKECSFNINKALNSLYKYKIIDINEGKVILKEKILYMR